METNKPIEHPRSVTHTFVCLSCLRKGEFWDLKILPCLCERCGKPTRTYLTRRKDLPRHNSPMNNEQIQPQPTETMSNDHGALQGLSTEEMIVCQFCGYKFDERCGIYGCPNCEGEGLEDETPENAKSIKSNYFQPSIAEPKTGNAPQTTQNPPIEKPIWYNGVAMKKKPTIATLKKLLPEGSTIEEVRDEDGGWFWISAPDWLAWKSTGTNTITARWYDSTDSPRSSAIESAIEDVSDGTEPASESTVWAMGWEGSPPTKPTKP